MDSDNQLTISTKDESSNAAAPSKRGLFLSTYRQQRAWSLPDNIIYYITKNPSSSKCYEKMIQTCKHFFIKNPLLVVSQFYLKYQNKRWDARFNGKLVDINKITSKIWVTYKISISCDQTMESPILSPIISKIHKSDIKEFYLYGQDIYYQDLKFLALECEKFCFHAPTVMDENGSVMPLEKILEILPNVKDFVYRSGYIGHLSSKIISSETASELLKIPHFSKLANFYLYGVPEAFDIDTFYDYTKKNKNTSIILHFCSGLSDGYKIRLQAIIDEIIENESREYNPLIDYIHRGPLFIQFKGHNTTSYAKMCNLLFSP